MNHDTIDLRTRLARADAVARVRAFVVRHRAERLVAATADFSARVAEIAPHAAELIPADRLEDIAALADRLKESVDDLRDSGGTLNTPPWETNRMLAELSVLFQSGKLPPTVAAALKVAAPDRQYAWNGLRKL